MTETPPTPLDRMRSSIQLAAFHYIVCLKAIPTNADHRLKIGTEDYVFEAVGRTDSNKLHGEFQRWAARAVLRDLIDDFSVFLFEVYRDAVRSKPEGVYSATLDQFERKGIEDQLATLASDFGIDSAWIVRLVGYNRARNCLAHRQGVVGARDTTDGNELVVRWLAARMEVVGGQATPFVDVVSPMKSLVRAQHVLGEAARLELSDKEKRIRAGSVLSFEPTEILAICQTFQLAASAFSGLAQRASARTVAAD